MSPPATRWRRRRRPGPGVGPAAVGFVLGIAKAYSTRVGAGPFPTELSDATGQLLGDRGNEFGTVTGRRRRCGWFDAVLVRQAVKVGGINGLALTKLDVLDGLPELKICTGYRIRGERYRHLPAAPGAQAAAEPEYEVMEGWTGSTRGARSWADLPAQAVKYVRRIEELVEAPVTLLSHQPRARRHDPGEGSVRGVTPRRWVSLQRSPVIASTCHAVLLHRSSTFLGKIGAHGHSGPDPTQRSPDRRPICGGRQPASCHRWAVLPHSAPSISSAGGPI